MKPLTIKEAVFISGVISSLHDSFAAQLEASAGSKEDLKTDKDAVKAQRLIARHIKSLTP